MPNIIFRKSCNFAHVMEKQNRQTVVSDYIYNNYVQFSRLRHDMISNKVQIRVTEDGLRVTGDGLRVTGWRDITTSDVNDIVCDCSEESGLSISAKEVMAVLQSHRVPDVHPLREYVENCRPCTSCQADWIGWLAERVTVEGGEDEQRLWLNCFRKWFVAMVASWLRDDVVNQQVLVLIGRQGIYKTTWLEHLLPPELRAYGCKMANSTQLNKDERLRIAEYGLIALDEIDAMTAKELNVMKSVITASDISERAAYGYTKERRLRLASFCASGNKQEFLTDLTGNRRWLPFRVTSIQNPFYTMLPYEQIYAEARYLIEHGFQYWFDLEDIERIEAHNDDFRAQENEEQLLGVWFDVPADGYGQFMTTAEISDKLVTRGSIKHPMPLNRLGMLLQQAGFASKRVGKTRTRGWLVRERGLDEVNANRNINANG